MRIFSIKSLFDRNMTWQRDCINKIADFVNKQPERIINVQNEGVWAHGYFFDEEEHPVELQIKAIRTDSGDGVEILVDSPDISYDDDDIRFLTNPDGWYWLVPDHHEILLSDTLISILECIRFRESKEYEEQRPFLGTAL